jgi:hypothetical protein
VVIACQPGHDWSSLPAAIFARLDGGAGIPSIEIDALASALWYLRETNKTSLQVVTRLVSEGHLMHHMHQAFVDGNNSALAWCIMLTAHVAPAFTAPPAVGNSQAGFAELAEFAADPSTRPAVVSSLAERTPVDRMERIWLPLLDSGTATPLVVAVLAFAFESERAGAVLAPSEVLKRWRFLRNEVFAGGESRFAAMLRPYVEETAVLRELIGMPLDPEDSELYVLLLGLGGADNAGFVRWLIEGLQKVDSATWLRALKKDGSIVSLLAELERDGHKYVGDTAFHDGIRQFGDWLVAGKPCPPGVKRYRQTICTSLRSDARGLLRKDLLDSASGHEKNPGPAFFEFFGEELGDAQTLTEQPDVIRRLLIPLVTKRNSAGLRWLVSVVERDPSFVEASGEVTALADFKRRLAKAAIATPDDASDAIKRLSEALGVAPAADDESAASDEPAAAEG